MSRTVIAAIVAAGWSALALAGQGHGLPDQWLGIYEGSRFRTVDGRCSDCTAPRPALWYFEGDLVAVPSTAPAQTVGYSHVSVADDVRTWAEKQTAPPILVPFMSWMGASELISGARLGAPGESITLYDGAGLAFSTAPKIPSNRSFFNADSAKFLAARSIRARGRSVEIGGKPGFEARTLWPEDFRIDAGTAKPQPLGTGESIATLLQAEDGGAKAPFATRLLWRREVSDDSKAPRAVLAFMLNGAQGDDDEAHGGHFAIATGWHRGDGQWADWLVNNFYNLGSVSEKGIVASMLPMDNYLTDLNSGQAWYRPSYMLVAVLRKPDAAQWYQAAMVRVFDRFYRHHIEYDHARSNCAGISIDTLSGLGWRLPTLGPTSRVKAVLGYFYSSITDASFASGRRSFNYMLEERSRLFPRVAFETVSQELLSLLAAPERAGTPYERLLRDDVEAVMFVRIPQIPSSRAYGSYPVASYDEYMARVPKDRKDWKIVPVDPRPFPDNLRDGPAVEPALPDAALGTLAFSGLALVVVTPVALWRRRRNGRRHKA